MCKRFARLLACLAAIALVSSLTLWFIWPPDRITPEQFAKVLAALPDGKARGGKGTKGGPKSETNLQPFFNFLYATGCRLGAAKRFSGTT